MAAKRKTTTKTTRAKTTAAKPRARKGSGRKRPEIKEHWSILLFGIGFVLLALTYVDSSSAGWEWIRSNLFFGVFGASTYLLAPIVLYVAVLIATGKPVKKLAVKLCLLLFLISGVFLIFSRVDMKQYNLNDGLVQLHALGKDTQTLSGGIISAVFGWSLLTLCGRPGANIIIAIMLLIGVMFATSVTPAMIYYYFTGKAGRVKSSMAERAEVRAARAEQQAYEAEQLRMEAEAENAEAEPIADAKAKNVYIQREIKNASLQKRDRLARSIDIDIDLGPVPIAETELKEDVTYSDIGPGGTFGINPIENEVKQPRRATKATVMPAPEAPAAAPLQEPEKAKASTPAAKPTPDLAQLIQKATGLTAELEVDANDQLKITAVEETTSGYAYPPLRLFQKQPPLNEQNVQQELEYNAELLVKTLSSFGVQTRIVDISRGPSVTRYELQPLAGVKISRITGLADDIALNLAATGVRIEAPIPGKAAVGVEVPNKNSSSVNIRTILEAPTFTQSKSPLTMALGQDIAGKNWTWDLIKMPHVLIAGSTGSGKSVCINAIIMSFLYKSSPEDVKLIMIDPKMVELSDYNGIPHLLMPVVTEPRKAAGALGSAVAEMEKRYRTFADLGVRNIEAYNRLALQEGRQKMPYMAIIIDELADLMMVAGKEVEDYICRIAQKARAAGMHLIVATQRPSVDVITGLIKANIPSRIAFAVSSQIDSRTILDGAGAEKLLGKGDMLFMPVGASKPTRIQGTYVHDDEIRDVQQFLKNHASAEYDETMIAEMEKCAASEKGSSSGGGDSSDAKDSMFDTAVEAVLDAGTASTSYLQRRCKLGYARAARIMDEMEQQHIIGPSEGAKPRQVLINRQQWLEMSMNEIDSEE